VGTGAAFCLLAAFRPTSGGWFALYVLLMVTRNAWVAVSDGGAEGLSVDANAEEVSGTMQAWVMGGRMAGLALGSAAGGPVTERMGYSCLLLLLGGVIAAFAPISCAVREERVEHADSGNSSNLPGDAETGLELEPLARSGKESPAQQARVPLVPSQPAASPPPSELSLLWQAARRPAMMALLAHVFACNAGLYAIDFPIVAWMQEAHGFTVAEVGWLIFVSALGNLAFAIPAGIAFDRWRHKRLLLAAAALLVAGSALVLLPCTGKAALFAAQFLVAGAQGCVLTVQTSTVRLIADDRIGAATFGLVLGAMNGAALVGTLLGGALADRCGIPTVYVAGASIAAASVVFTPWIDVAASGRTHGGDRARGDDPGASEQHQLRPGSGSGSGVAHASMMRRAFGTQRGMLGLAAAANELRVARGEQRRQREGARDKNALRRWHGRDDGYGSGATAAAGGTLAILVAHPHRRVDEEGDVGLGFQGRAPLGGRGGRCGARVPGPRAAGCVGRRQLQWRHATRGGGGGGGGWVACCRRHQHRQ
jgi:predicted MFS family arabinose efflux permease